MQGYLNAFDWWYDLGYIKREQYRNLLGTELPLTAAQIRQLFKLYGNAI
jgi:hypothetical protein